VTIRLVPDNFPACGSPLQVVAEARRYFTLHFREPQAVQDAALAMGVTDECLNFSFDEVRGMTPAQALLEHRLNKLFTALTNQPRQGLGRAIRACGLEQTSGVVSLFEQTFGIDMPLFLLTCRRAADDRLFRRLHPDPQALVLPQ
jgi:methylphosphotriester-DNA--protein-cysteine methyltransferase